jgi:methionyl-tRNA formyltransferase
LEAGFNIRAIVTKPDAKAGRGRRLTAPEAKIIGQQYGIEVWQPQHLAEIHDHIQGLNDPLGVLSSFGRIIPKAIIDLFPKGIVNLHPSLLPQYRGPSPIETAIFNGDTQTGVTLMRLNDQMDTGPIYAQEIIKLNGNETKAALYDKLASLGTELLVHTLPSIAAGLIQPTPQDDTKATYCQRLDKSMSPLDVVNRTATGCYNQVRAFAGFPKSTLSLGGVLCTITQASVNDVKITTLDQLCQDGRFLIIEKLVPPNGHEITAQDFINGYSPR